MQWARLIGTIILCEAAGIIGAFFTTPAIPTWYASLTPPALLPPSWVFGPVWTVLYAFLGVTLYLLWRAGTAERPVRIALMWFAVQLLLNVAWSAAFFGLRSPLAGIMVITPLWCAILGTLWSAARVSRTAAWLIAPYLAWVSFAVYLNASFLALN